ncbi:MAG: 30S ribosomal protein S20 [Planctomycetes bacterium]|nr:30S ribosomal protein S20 [Planctomycetota bacterium]
MAHSDSARKRIRQNRSRNERNRAQRSSLRAAIKGLRTALAGKTPEVQKQLSGVESRLDKAAKTGLIKTRQASRLKARLKRQAAKTA